MTVPVCMFTADHRHDVLRVALWLYAKYWNWPLTVYGFKRPVYMMEKNVTFESLGNMADYPADKWSDAVIKALEGIQHEFIIILLEDYWLTRYVDKTAVGWLVDYMRHYSDIVRGDLTSDRLYAPAVRDIDGHGYLDIIENDPPQQYHFSTQAAIWRRKELLDLMKPSETPWQAELEGTSRMIDAMRRGKPGRAVGTRQFPVRYLIAVQGGKLALDGGYQKPGPVMDKADMDIAIKLMEVTNGNTDIAFAGLAK